ARCAPADHPQGRLPVHAVHGGGDPDPVRIPRNRHLAAQGPDGLKAQNPMLDKLLRLARNAVNDRAIAPLLASCRLLVSERGQANVYALALRVIEGYRSLPAARREAFFAALATEFGPVPQVVLDAATLYAQAPTAEHLARLT